VDAILGGVFVLAAWLGTVIVVGAFLMLACFVGQHIWNFVEPRDPFNGWLTLGSIFVYMMVLGVLLHALGVLPIIPPDDDICRTWRC